MSVDLFNKEAIRVLVEHCQSGDFDVARFAGAMNLSTKQLYLKCNKHLSKSPGDLIRQHRIARSIELLDSGLDTDMVALRSGYKTLAAFRVAFKNETGISVGKYKKEISSNKVARDAEIKASIIDVIARCFHVSGFSTSLLAKEMGISDRTLTRYCQAHFSTTPLLLIRRFRVERARALIEQGAGINDVVEQVGLPNKRALRVAFKDETGVTLDAFVKDPQIIEKQPILEKISAYLSADVNLDSDVDVKRALREELNILLPQRASLIASIEASIDRNPVLNSIVEYRNLMHKQRASKQGENYG